MNHGISNHKIGPEKVLRAIAFFSLVAMGVCAIYVARRPGDFSVSTAQIRATGGYFTFEFLLFGLFYGQYVWVPRFLKRPLHVGLGFAQTFLCLALVLFGLFPIWLPDLGAAAAFNVDNMAVTIAILGEAIFIGNVCWTLLQPQSAVRPLVLATEKSTEPPPLQATLSPEVPLQALKSARLTRFRWTRWLKPENPMEKFGVTAIFLVVGGGAISLALPESRFLVLWGGRNYFLAMGVLWWICAIPFAAFSLAYWLHAGRRSAPYDKWLTKVHLAVTFVWLLDFVRIVTLAQWSLTSRLPDLLMDSYTFELYVILGAAIALGYINMRRAPRTTLKPLK